MARKKTNVEESSEILVSSVAGQNGEQDNHSEQVPQSSLVEHLYNLDAEVVLAITGADKIAYTLEFPGWHREVKLSLPPGHYILCRIPKPLFSTPGLRPVVNPRKT